MVTQVDLHQSPLLGKPLSPLVLRVEGTERDGQTVRLERTKCVIGSAASCSLRLAAAGIRPRHCVIWRGSAGMALQRIDGEVFVNGQSVVESPLVSGDLITIGAVSFRIDPDPNLEAAPHNERRVLSLEKQLGEIRGRNRRRMHRLVEIVRQSMNPEAAVPTTKSDPAETHDDEETERLRHELQQTLEASEAKIAALQQQLESLEQENRNLQAHSVSAAETMNQHSTSNAEQHAEIEQLRHELQQSSESNEAKIAELQQQLETLEQENRDLAANGGSASTEAIEAQEKAQRDVADANERLQVLSRGWSQREEELTRRIEELESMSQQLSEPQASYAPSHSENQYEEEPEEEAEPEEPVAPQPQASQTSVADVLAKFGFNPHADDDEEEEYEPSPPPAPVSYHEEPTPASAADEDEVSIEEYMSSLMNRVRGRDGSQSATQAKPESPKAPEPPKKVVDQTPFNPGEFVPSRKAPEQTSDLRALRDLANQSARSAIDVHTLKRWNNVYVTKLIVAIVAFVTAICLLVETRSFVSLQFLGASMGIIIAIFWSLQAVIVYNQLRSAKKVASPQEVKILDQTSTMPFDSPGFEQDGMRDDSPSAE
ncbi:FHA domain-containing protein [Blastopirellula sp. JC732]|uniref:FHA domain-containing protein n=1 Tax=Blastopirellula sediminis TaxID=2894196 RepID=A0A9X1MRI3_9BACT|nr:FHA domain-containing protein [Blastopirellula sediminis]MCC9605164.1 FHA domain-containing protein [Blastopirellula sediminis]MCC9631536.1 FHA domain-containing protein [Blastopirellula sediminis]